MGDERKKRVELPTLDEIDAELAELAGRRKTLLRIRRFVTRLEADAAREPEDPDGC